MIRPLLGSHVFFEAEAQGQVHIQPHRGRLFRQRGLHAHVHELLVNVLLLGREQFYVLIRF